MSNQERGRNHAHETPYSDLTANDLMPSEYQVFAFILGIFSLLSSQNSEEESLRLVNDLGQNRKWFGSITE
ncbi:hypothetical protein SLA2020_377030 [Shorea laevis]